MKSKHPPTPASSSLLPRSLSPGSGPSPSASSTPVTAPRPLHLRSPLPVILFLQTLHYLPESQIKCRPLRVFSRASPHGTLLVTLLGRLRPGLVRDLQESQAWPLVTPYPPCCVPVSGGASYLDEWDP